MSDSSFVAVDFDSFLAFVNDSCIEAAANDPDYVGAEGDRDPALALDPDYVGHEDYVDEDGYADDGDFVATADALALADRLRRLRALRLA